MFYADAKYVHNLRCRIDPFFFCTRNAQYAPRRQSRNETPTTSFFFTKVEVKEGPNGRNNIMHLCCALGRGINVRVIDEKFCLKKKKKD